MSEKKPFVVQMHSSGNSYGRTYKMSMDILFEAIKKGALKIEVVDCAWEEIKIRDAEIERLREALKQATDQLNADYKLTPLDGRGALIKKLQSVLDKESE